MKLRILAALFLLASVAGAEAQSSFAGKYLGIFYFKGKPIAAANMTIDDTGVVRGNGQYTNFRKLTLSGTVDATGTVTLTKKGNDVEKEFTATFSVTGRKFSSRTPKGLTFKGKKVRGVMPQVGVYAINTDIGERGLVIVDRNLKVTGTLQHLSGESVELHGNVDPTQLGAITVDGIFFFGTFDGLSLSGEYSNAFGLKGSFYGKKIAVKKK